MASNGHPAPKDAPVNLFTSSASVENGGKGDDECTPKPKVIKDRTSAHRELLERLPRFRPSLRPYHFTYYAVGHDPAQSSLSGLFLLSELSRNMKENVQHFRPGLSYWGREDGGDQLMRMRQLSDEERAQLSFFYGGCGDCRHIIATLYDLGRQISEGVQAMHRGNHVHFLLNDCNASILARFSVLLVALHDLSRFQTENLQRRNNEEVKQLFAFLHYVYFSPVVPVFVHLRLCSIIRRLLRDRYLYPTLIFPDQAWERVKKVLEFWLERLPIADSDKLEREAEKLAKWYATTERNFLQRSKAGRRRKLFKDLKDMVLRTNLVRASDLDDPSGSTRATLEELLEDNAVKASALSVSNLIPYGAHADLVYAAVHCVLPPVECLLHAYPPEVRHYHRMANERDQVCFAKRDLVYGIARQIAKVVGEGYDSGSLFKDMAPNVTGLDASYEPDYLQYFFGGVRPDGYEQQPPRWNPLSQLAMFYASTVIDFPPQSGGSRASLFDLSCNIWEKAALAVKFLHNDPRYHSSLGFEMSLGEMNTVAKEIRFAEQSRAAAKLPTRFLRAFLSNVPDYTGMLYPLLEIAPILLQSDKAFLRCNVLYERSAWGTCEDWLHEFVLLANAKEVKDMYAVDVRRESSLATFLWLGKSNPEPLLPQFIDNAFQRLLIAVAFPPLQPVEPRLSHYPESLVALVELMLVLLDRGVGKEIIAGAMETILRGEIRIRNPRPPRITGTQERKTVSVAPFLLELRTLLALYGPVLNIAIDPALELPLADNIVLHTVHWVEEPAEEGTYTIGLVIFPNHHLEKSARKLAVMDKSQLDDVHFLSVFEWSALDLTAKFYLPEKARAEMLRKRLNAMLFCSGSFNPVTSPTKL